MTHPHLHGVGFFCYHECMTEFDYMDEAPSLEAIRILIKNHKSAEVYLVGGAVRDVFLGRETHDIDLVVRGMPPNDLKAFLERHGSVDLVGTRFGVFKFRPKNGRVVIDIALPRTEDAGGSGRYRDFTIHMDPDLPIETDLARRDFTINAMAWNLGTKTLSDPHGGRADIERRQLRAVGRPSERFNEDATRLFRALRFAVQLGFTIEPATWNALGQGIARLGERIVAPEPLAKEFLKSLEAAPERSVELWDDAGALGRLIPELIERDTGALGRLSSDAFRETFPHPPTADVILAVLLYPLGAAVAGEIVRRLRLSSAEDFDVSAERVTWLIRHFEEPFRHAPSAMPASHVQRLLYDRQYRGIDLLMVSAAITNTSHVQAWMQTPELKPLLDGDTVMRITKLPGGPEIGKILSHLIDLQGNGTLSSSAEAESYLREHGHDPAISDSLRRTRP